MSSALPKSALSLTNMSGGPVLRGKIRTPQGLRDAFAEYFAAQGHAVVPSSSLVATGDPTILFANSGMVQFKDVFAGTEKRPYKRALSCQKCLRVSGKHNDFEQIGRTARHHTFFEMLGNFSFGDYFKRDAIRYAWQFLTEVIGLPKSLLWVSVHENDNEARHLWSEMTDVPPERIIGLGDDSNLWAMGDRGPWGYCSEIFCYIGEFPDKQSNEEFLKDDGTYLEIWNLVFMQFYRHADGSVTNLPLQCIDTGMGLERLASVVQGVPSNFDTDDLRGIIGVVERLTGIVYEGLTYDKAKASSSEQFERDVAMRVIADHSRASAFMIADGVAPGNEGESYVLRRLIRRAIRFGTELTFKNGPFMADTVAHVIASMGQAYPQLVQERDRILTLVHQEEERFRSTLDNGVALLDQALEGKSIGFRLAGDLAFKLYDTFGFPVDLTRDVLVQRGMTLDEDGFNTALDLQRERSRAVGMGGAAEDLAGFFAQVGDPGLTKFVGYTELEVESAITLIGPIGSDGLQPIFVEATPFYAEMGGQVGDSGTIKIAGDVYTVVTTKKIGAGAFAHFVEVGSGNNPPLAESLRGTVVKLVVDRERRIAIARHHSATHLLNGALRKILGGHVLQRGSFVNETRLRFDFSHDEAIPVELLTEIESVVNKEVQSNYTVVTEEMEITTAKSRGAVATFGEKYGDVVRVVEIGPSSVELCGGTHVAAAGEIGCFVLQSEGSVSAGVRRIEGVVGQSGVAALQELQTTTRDLCGLLKSSSTTLVSKVEGLLNENKSLQKEVRVREQQIAKLFGRSLKNETQLTGNGTRFHASIVDTSSKDLLLDIASELVASIGSGVVVVCSKELQAIAVKVSKDLSGKIHAGNLVQKLSEITGGKGGGRPDSAFLGGADAETFGVALEQVGSLF